MEQLHQRINGYGFRMVLLLGILAWPGGMSIAQDDPDAESTPPAQANQAATTEAADDQSDTADVPERTEATRLEDEPDDMPPATRPERSMPDAVDEETAQPMADSAVSDDQLDERFDAGDDAQTPTADEVIRDMMRRREQTTPMIEPTQPPTVPTTTPPTTITGTAPGTERLEPVEDGSTVIMRRGRIVATEGGPTRWMFIFDGDGRTMDDNPMYLMPCKVLQNVEQIAAEQGDSTIFIISGQVFEYHNANYLLPTLIKLRHDRRNLQP